MPKIPSEYQSYLESISTHLIRAQNSHHNTKAPFIKAALTAIEKLRLELNRDLGILIDNLDIKKGDFKSTCELCGLELPSIKTLVLGHYIPYYICFNCHKLNENIKRNMNSMLPPKDHIARLSFNEELAKRGGKMPLMSGKSDG